MTSLPTHTPGPLNVQPMPGRSYRILGGPRLSRLADVLSTATHNGEANARLFAAAPDLLAACRLALSEHETVGAHKWSTSQQRGLDYEDATCDVCEALRLAIANATTI